jgi:hypothetical protein
MINTQKGPNTTPIHEKSVNLLVIKPGNTKTVILKAIITTVTISCTI